MTGAREKMLSKNKETQLNAVGLSAKLLTPLQCLQNIINKKFKIAYDNPCVPKIVISYSGSSEVEN